MLIDQGATSKELDIKNVPVESRFHWYKHYYTKSIKLNERNIEVLFEFPDIDSFDKGIEQLFIEESKKWLSFNKDAAINDILPISNRNHLLKCTYKENIEFSATTQDIDNELRKYILKLLKKDKQIVLFEKQQIYKKEMVEKFNFELIQQLSKVLLEKNTYTISYDEFVLFVDNQFGKSAEGYNLEINIPCLINELVFSNIIIFEKNILKFSSDSFLFFFYSKYIIKNNKHDFLLQQLHLKKYKDVIAFYTGLLMNCRDVVELCAVGLLEKENLDFRKITIIANQIFNDRTNWFLNKDPIFVLDDNDYKKKFDNQEQNEELLVKKVIPKSLDLNGDEHDFFSLLTLVCTILKDSDYIPNPTKKETLALCLNYYVYIICELINLIKDESNLEKEKLDKQNNNYTETKMKLIIRQVIWLRQ